MKRTQRSFTFRSLAWASLVLTALAQASLEAGDWPRFRGPDGRGISSDPNVPTSWSDDENLQWKTELPGPGLSSPIVVGGKVFVTCYTGYGTNKDDPGEMKNLKRHLICLSRETGDILWNSSVAATLPEDPYEGYFQEHGYASHTPVSDGERVYAFFGKSGVVAFDMEGNQLWDTSVGTESGMMGWGTASSPILYNDLVIVPATAESEALVALDKETGSKVWRKEAAGFSGTWGTPVVIETDKRAELVIAVPGEVWAFSPEDGKLLWYAEGIGSNTASSSIVEGDGKVFFLGGRGGEAAAVRLGGEGNVSESHVAWSEQLQGGIVTPVVDDGHLFAFNGNRATCLSTESGETLGQARLPSPSGQTAEEPERGRGGRGGGGRGGGQSYASPVIINGRIYLQTRQGTVYVIEANPEMTVVAQNRFTTDDSDFNSTPAVSDGRLFLRSNKALYCVAQQ